MMASSRYATSRASPETLRREPLPPPWRDVRPLRALVLMLGHGVRLATPVVSADESTGRAPGSC
jgi:hypothetical protein